jgi:hypothetical protein
MCPSPGPVQRWPWAYPLFKENLRTMNDYIRNTLVAIATLCLLATSAYAGQATTSNYGPAYETLLLRSQITTLDAAGECVNLYNDTTANVLSVTCEDADINEWVVPQNAQVRSIVLIQTIGSTAADVCDIELEVSGTEVKAISVAMSDTAQTRTKTAFKYDLADGDHVGVSLNTGTSCVAGTPPQVILELWGVWVADASF